MPQAFLVERFQLKFHRENRDVPGLAIVVGKNGHSRRRHGKSFGDSGKPRQAVRWNESSGRRFSRRCGSNSG